MNRLLGTASAALILLFAAAIARPCPASEPLPGAPAMPPALQSKLQSALAARAPGYEPRTRNRRADGSPLYTNRLILETSPYLLQHAHNPVDWYPWGQEAFEAAKRLGRPVLVSIGYSTCHWCHVMEEESFDDPETARLLNAGFVAIKVDRESRPDVDAIYTAAVQALGQSSGWPLNVWVTPDREPFYAGTYFPPTPSRGRPGFGQVLEAISERWSSEPDALRRIGGQLAAAVARELEVDSDPSAQPVDSKIIELAQRSAIARIDRRWGGSGGPTKFPSSTPLRFLLRHYRRTGDAESLELASLTLERMARGGIYDQVGGGFHRYSTDRRWLVPHFEKMLYDNALLVPAYLEASQITGREDFARIAREIVEYVLRDMTSADGVFFSATDADSRNARGEPEEGWYFTWEHSELETVLGPRRAEIVGGWYGVSRKGSFEGRNVLHVPRSQAEAATKLGITRGELVGEVAEGRELLLSARQKRSPPLRDEKIIVAWNGLMISAAAQAGFALDDARFIEAARRAADFILVNLRANGRLQRIYKDGRADGPAFLEDHAFLVAGLLDLYEADPDPRWLREAMSIQALQDRYYADETRGGYFETAKDGEALIVRQKPARDDAEPSGNSVAALNLLRLHELSQKPEYRERAERLLMAFRETLARRPTALSVMLLAVDFFLDRPFEIVIVTPRDGAGLQPILAPLRSAFVPNRVLAVVAENDVRAAHAPLVPLVESKRAIGGRTTAYVCVNRVCAYPTSDPLQLAEQIAVVAPLPAEPEPEPKALRD